MATTDSIVSKLPANVEAERSILGAILLDNMAYNEAAENLRPDDFSLDSHRRIYSRMMDLMESSRPIDIITLVEELERKRELQAIGDVGRHLRIARWCSGQAKYRTLHPHCSAQGSIARIDQCIDEDDRARF